VKQPWLVCAVELVQGTGIKAGLLVGGMASLGLAIGELHLLSIAVVGSDIENIA
jgi:hypothetical protein